MNSVSISQLKMNPAAVFGMAVDYPVAVDSRNKGVGYIVGSRLFENMVEWMEDMVDNRAIEHAIKSGELDEATDYDDFARELGI